MCAPGITSCTYDTRAQAQHYFVAAVLYKSGKKKFTNYKIPDSRFRAVLGSLTDFDSLYALLWSSSTNEDFRL